ncbi:hypothetical protein ACFVUH_25160 [Kitasatospora sp. NPDC058032]|uniref:hypothetical protein n=1 Tax=Kitasatospora sp. NPDC058032 TaxID=3346307 RepID=UPI0036DABE84
MSAYSYFTSECGTNSWARSNDGFKVNTTMMINDSTDFKDCVTIEGGGHVYGVNLNKSPNPLYGYRISVDACGPTGMTSTMYLSFQDRNGEIYHLSIYKSARIIHSLDYSSSNPEIIEFRWSNMPLT